MFRCLVIFWRGNLEQTQHTPGRYFSLPQALLSCPATIWEFSGKKDTLPAAISFYSTSDHAPAAPILNILLYMSTSPPRFIAPPCRNARDILSTRYVDHPPTKNYLETPPQPLSPLSKRPPFPCPGHFPYVQFRANSPSTPLLPPPPSPLPHYEIPLLQPFGTPQGNCDRKKDTIIIGLSKHPGLLVACKRQGTIKFASEQCASAQCNFVLTIRTRAARVMPV